MLTHLSANIALCVTEANTLAYYILTLYCDRGKGLKVSKTDVSLIAEMEVSIKTKQWTLFSLLGVLRMAI